MFLQNTHWSLDADVIVIGYGAAGAVAAITAKDAGASVLVVEKQDSAAPMSSSYMSSGVIICPDSIPEAKRYMESLYKVAENLYWTEPDILDVWARYCAENRHWVESMGALVDPLGTRGENRSPGCESIKTYRVRGFGPAMMRLFYDQVKSRGIPVMPGLSATRLLVDSKSEVVGVRAKRNTGEGIDIQARRAVILATGGFEFDELMKLQYLPVYPSYFFASPASTGDGIRMALDAGAQLWHMNCCSAAFAMKFPGIRSGMPPSFDGSTTVMHGGYGLESPVGYVVVDRYGKRYTNENCRGHVFYYELTGFDSHTMTRPRVPSYWVFDQTRMNCGPLPRAAAAITGPTGLDIPGVCHWSGDNSDELKRGWIEQANTVKDLGLKLGAEHLVETVRSYNLYCKHGKDPEFNRESGTLVPLATPPYYAVKLWPGGPNTEGGPRRNRKSQVMGADGDSIPRLYSAGELGSIYGMLYPAGGGNLAECIAFGRIAGENAARQAPR